MQKKIAILLFLSVMAVWIVPASAETEVQTMPVRPGFNTSMMEPVLSDLEGQGYDTAEMRDLLLKAEEARSNGDMETSQAMMDRFRRALQDAVAATGIEIDYAPTGNRPEGAGDFVPGAAATPAESPISILPCVGGAALAYVAWRRV
ncbi:hypothetical protein [Methanofollis fontis]|uniref:Uncharacterized protein n=1 Tax=Methanofollis fontis TaxID=2052832 RepID=A0A483CNX4_9EURY|nr:hypothetical protein [Methanofollis fontis]TAJ44710.1 hypothetical protein CUJ86_05260 [Methanofollis fontis]